MKVFLNPGEFGDLHISIPTGQIEGRLILYAVDEARQFQYQQVRLKAAQDRVAAGQDRDFNTSRSD